MNILYLHDLMSLNDDTLESAPRKALQYKMLRQFPNAKIVGAYLGQKTPSRSLPSCLKFPSKNIDHEDPDLIIVDPFVLPSMYPSFLDKYPDAKCLLISTENVFRQATSYTSQVRQLIKKGLSLLRLREKYSPMHLSSCVEYIKDTSGRTFSILTNRIPDASNVLSVPLWMHYDDLVAKAIEVKRVNAYRDKRKFCAFISRHLTPARIEFFRKLSRYKRVDRYFYTKQDELKLFKRFFLREAFGNFQINFNLVEYPGEDVQSSRDNWKIYKDYKFVISFENSVADDYISEKIISAMAGNSVPLYWGTPSVSEYFNPDSFIDYNRFQSFDAMVEKIIELDQDDAKYQAMLDQPFFVGNQLPEKAVPWMDGGGQEVIEFVNRILGKSGAEV